MSWTRLVVRCPNCKENGNVDAVSADNFGNVRVVARCPKCDNMLEGVWSLVELMKAVKGVQ